MRFSGNRYYIERYVKCRNCGILIYGEGTAPVRKLMRAIAGWRLRNGNYKLPIEQKMFDLFVKLTGQTEEDKIELDPTSGVTPNPVQS